MARLQPGQSDQLSNRLRGETRRPSLATFRARRRRRNNAGSISLAPHLPMLLTLALHHRPPLRLLRHRAHDSWHLHSPLLLRVHVPRKDHLEVDMASLTVPVLCFRSHCGSLAQAAATVAQRCCLALGWLLGNAWNNPPGFLTGYTAYALRLPFLALDRGRTDLPCRCSPLRYWIPRTLFQGKVRCVRSKP